MSNKNIVTKLNVSVNILYQNLDLPLYLNVTLNCLNENSIVSRNMDISKTYLYCCFVTVSYSCCFCYQNWRCFQVKCCCLYKVLFPIVNNEAPCCSLWSFGSMKVDFGEPVLWSSPCYSMSLLTIDGWLV